MYTQIFLYEKNVRIMRDEVENIKWLNYTL